MGKREKKGGKQDKHEENGIFFSILVVTGETHETTTVNPINTTNSMARTPIVSSISLAFHFIRERTQKIVSQLIHRPSEPLIRYSFVYGLRPFVLVVRRLHV